MRCRLLILCAALVSLSAGCDPGDITGPEPADGDAILFASSRGGQYSICSILPDGTGRRSIFHEAAEVRGSSWSPAKDLIVFTSSRGGSFDIWTMNSGGQQLVRLTDTRQPDEFPVWSPAGDRIAFTSSRDGGPEIYVMNADGSDQTRLTDNDAIDSFPCWSPDGNQLAFQSSRGSTSGLNDIWIMNADGTDPVRVTTFAAPSPPAFATHPAWSPVADLLAFVGTSQARAFDVFLVNHDGTGLRNLTNDPGSYSGLDWSPDGLRLVCIASRSGSNDVWSMNADGSDPVNLTDTPVEQELSPDW